MSTADSVAGRMDRAVIALTCLTVILLGVLLAGGFTRSLWLDEANSVFIADHGVRGLIDALRRDNNLPLYYLLLSFWIHFFGSGETSVRMLSWVFYAASAPAMYFLARVVNTRRSVAVLAAGCFAASINAIEHGQNVRMYSLLCLLTILSTLCFLRAFVPDRQRGRWLAGYILLNSLGVFTHYWFLFVLLGHFACMMLVLDRSIFRRLFAAQAVSCVPFLLLWGASALHQFQSGANSWMIRPALHNLATTTRNFYGSNGWMAFLVAVLVLLELERLRFRMRPPDAILSFARTRPFLISLVLFLTTLLVPFLVAQVKPIYTPGRYTIISLPFLALLIAQILDHFGRGVLGKGICLALLVSACLFQYELNVVPEEYSDRLTTDLLLQRARPGDVIIYSGLTGVGIDYYLGQRGAADRFRIVQFPSSVNEHRAWLDEESLGREQDRLVQEADAVADIAASRMAEEPGTRIWVVRGEEQQVAAAILGALDRRFGLEQVLPFQAYKYKSILIYAAPAPASPTATACAG